jgi:site-specific DNA-methyltransferase (adenine-specific)
MDAYYRDDLLTLYHAEALGVLAGLPAESIDAVVTDPPYSSGGQFRGDRMMNTTDKYVQHATAIQRPDFDGDNRDQRSYAYWCALWLGECYRLAKPGAVCLLFTDWRQLPTTTDALQAGGWVWRGVVPWDKTEAVRPQKGAYASQCEYVVWGSKGPLDRDQGRPCLPGFFRYIVRQADKFHLTGKPTPLLLDLLSIVPAGGVVLDPFAGSGTALVAARLRGLRAIGVEWQEDYCRVVVQRLRQQPLPLVAPVVEQLALDHAS